MLIWISGQSGAGKTTLGQNLAKYYDFVHFDCDVYYSGGDPLTESGQFVGSNRASQELKDAWSIIERNYGQLFDGNKVPVDEWAPALKCLCVAIADKAREHPKLVVTFSLYTRDVRRWVEGQIRRALRNDDDGDDRAETGRGGAEVSTTTSASLKFVVLNDADGAAAKRKLEQVKSAAAAQDMTMEEFVGQYGKEWKGDEQTLRELSRSQIGFEPGVEEESEMDVTVKEQDDADSVLAKVSSRLMLDKEKKSVPCSRGR